MGQTKAGGARRARQTQQRRAQIFRPERRLPASTREPTASGSRKRRARRRLRALFNVGPTAAHYTPATPPRALECRPLPGPVNLYGTLAGVLLLNVPAAARPATTP